MIHKLDEKDHQKKQDIRDKAKLYLQRAEEISLLIKPVKKDTNSIVKSQILKIEGQKFKGAQSPNTSNFIETSTPKTVNNPTNSSLTFVSPLDLQSSNYFFNASINNKLDLCKLTECLFNFWNFTEFNF